MSALASRFSISRDSMEAAIRGPEWHGHGLGAYYLIEEAAAARPVHSAAI